MRYVKLAVVMRPTKVTKAARQRQVHSCGGLIHASDEYPKTARALSKLPWVREVTASMTTERSVGTWRKGRKLQPGDYVMKLPPMTPEEEHAVARALLSTQLQGQMGAENWDLTEEEEDVLWHVIRTLELEQQ